MPKNFTVLTEPSKIIASGKTVVVNTCQSNIYLTDDELDASFLALDSQKKTSVLNALYALKPGESKSLASGTYNISFQSGWNCSCVIQKDL